MNNPGFRVALLDLDFVLYDPTKAALEALYPLIVPGGVVALDEYALKGMGESDAVDEFFDGTPPEMHSFPWALSPTAYFTKGEQVSEVKPIQIGERQVGPGHPALIIGEVGQAHDGSLGTAHAFIDAIADAGADAVKFQTHIAAEESTDEETFRVNFSYEDKTRPDYWKRMEFTERAMAQTSRACAMSAA